MSPTDRIARWMDAHGLHRGDPAGVTVLPEIEAALKQRLPDELHTLYGRFGPGAQQVFSPVVHAGVLNNWSVWTPQRSYTRMKKNSDPLWQLSPSVDIWLDTHEVTVLREDDVDESFPRFEDYWHVRLAELEASSFDPMTGLWLHPPLHARSVRAPDGLREFLFAELTAGREVHFPGIGLFSPEPPPKSDSTFDLNTQGAPPSLHPDGLDRCEPFSMDSSELAQRWGRDPEWVASLVEELHHAVDAELELGAVDLFGMFRLHAKHHEARVLNNADEPIEVPAYRQVTARVSVEIAREFADARS